MRKKTEQEMNDLCDKPNIVLKVGKFFKKRTICKWWMMFERNKWQICVW